MNDTCYSDKFLITIQQSGRPFKCKFIRGLLNKVKVLDFNYETLGIRYKSPSDFEEGFIFIKN